MADFTDTGDFHVMHGTNTVASLPIEFLHDGVPQLRLKSKWTPPQNEEFIPDNESNHSELLLQMLARPNIASRRHGLDNMIEVIAQTAVKPFVGVEKDAMGMPEF